MLYGFVCANGNSPAFNDALREQRIAFVEYGVNIVNIFEEIRLSVNKKSNSVKVAL